MDFYRKFFHKAEEIDKQQELLTKFRQISADLEKEFLRQKSVNADIEPILNFCNTFKIILEDEFYHENFTNPDDELWKLLNDYLGDSFSLKFVNNFKGKGNEEAIDKLLLWLQIELQEKSLCATFLKFSKNPEIVLRFYHANAIIRKDGEKVREILNRLIQLNFTLLSGNLDKYQAEKKEQNVESESDEASNKSLNASENISVKKPEPIDENQIKENLNRYKQLLESTKNQKQVDDRQSFMREEYKQHLEEKQQDEIKPFELIRKILGPKKERKSARRKSKGKVLRKTSSFDDLDAKKIAPTGLLKGIFFLRGLDKSHEHEKEHENKKLSISTYRKSDGKDNSPINEEANQSFRSDPKNFFTTDDMSPHNHSHDHDLNPKSFYFKNMKKSEVLFLQKYRYVLQEFEYREPPKKIIKVEEQEYKCYECRTQLNKILLKLWSKNAFCHYTGYWYCSNCMSEEKLYIPWYIQERLDFKKYHVCKKARDELYKCYSKPNVLIDHNSPVIKNNKEFYETLVMKRELHLIYDMICDSVYVSDLLRENMNLVLKINLFSVRNLVEINNGAMIRYIEKCMEMLTSHIKGRSLCQRKGVICPLCNSDTRIFPYDIKNTSVCRKCKSLYHSKCLSRRNCIVCQHNF